MGFVRKRHQSDMFKKTKSHQKNGKVMRILLPDTGDPYRIRDEKKQVRCLFANCFVSHAIYPCKIV